MSMVYALVAAAQEWVTEKVHTYPWLSAHAKELPAASHDALQIWLSDVRCLHCRYAVVFESHAAGVCRDCHQPLRGLLQLWSLHEDTNAISTHAETSSNSHQDTAGLDSI